MDIKELAARYQTSEQAMRKYLRHHEKKLNAEGEHVKRIGRVWQVDDKAIRMLDEMRGYVEPKVETVPARDELAELREDNRRLMAMLLAAKNDVIRLQQELLRLKEPPPSLLERFRNLFRKSSAE